MTVLFIFVRQLREPVPPLGKLIAVRALAAHLPTLRAEPHGSTTTCPAGPSNNTRCWFSTSRQMMRSWPAGMGWIKAA